MILTEDEAKTKRCQEGYAASPGAVRDPVTEYATIVEPAPQHIAVFAGSGSSMATISTARPATAPIFCLASGCNAWRWLRTREWADKYAVGRLADGADVGKGYCGKAGKP